MFKCVNQSVSSRFLVFFPLRLVSILRRGLVFSIFSSPVSLPLSPEYTPPCSPLSLFSLFPLSGVRPALSSPPFSYFMRIPQFIAPPSPASQSLLHEQHWPLAPLTCSRGTQNGILGMRFTPRISLLTCISEVIRHSLNCFPHKRADELFLEVNKSPENRVSSQKRSDINETVWNLTVL